jgi:signal transduction histidine kinase
MTFRSRLTIGLALAALLPLLALAFGVRREMSARLDQQAARRVASLVESIRARLAADAARARSRLRALSDGLAADNRFRLATRPGADRRWLLDWAGTAMSLSGFGLLQLRDDAGRILSSGHFRNEYDRQDPAVPRAVAAAGPGGALVRARTGDGTLLALAGVDSFHLADRAFTLVGGVPIDSADVAALATDPEIAATLAIGPSSCEPSPAESAGARVGPNPCGPGVVAAEIPIPFVDATPGGPPQTARIVVTRDLEPVRALTRRVDRWLLAALGLTLALAIVTTLALATGLSRPLGDLAAKTARVDLDRLDQDFATGRRDEIGALAGLLDAMTRRLRTSAARLREAERRAAVGDLARQVNHDVKNGLVPLRNVVRHLTQTAEREPDRLPSIFGERRATLESSIDYLEGLARNYARLAPQLDRSPSDPNAVMEEVARAAARDGVAIETRLASPISAVRADRVVLRRILENLVTNGIDALGGEPGRLVLATELVPGPEPRVRVTVTDSGRGMTREELDRAFEGPLGTEPRGHGLGLSVVRRLVTDLGGGVRVETAPGRGSTFIVEIPAA